MTSTPQRQCAQAVLDVVPAVMRVIRAEMRGRRLDLSVPQLRLLLFVARHDGSSLREVACHLGLTPPSASKMVDVLERRALLRRRASSQDRRRITLALTPAGSSRLKQALAETRRRLCARMEELEPAELETVTAAMGVLRRTFPASGSTER
ncbi:MAG TPA: MarR family transcriptional regulator [bacterium]|nr:MarR family transcriptional regulator [bacterium]